MLFAAVWLSRIPQTSAPVAPAEVFAAVKAGQSLADTKRRLHVAALSMMVGGDCSAADACWVVAQDALDVVAEDGTILRSVFARDLLSYYARGKGMAYKGTEHLVKEELLDVLWAVDPHSFFFAYVDADARKLVAVQPPARVGAFRVPVTRSKAAQARVVAGDAWADELLPAGVKFQRLVLVLRKHGLLMLLADADDTCFAHLLALRLGDPSPSGRTWPDVNTDLRTAARAALRRVVDDDGDGLLQLVYYITSILHLHTRCLFDGCERNGGTLRKPKLSETQNNAVSTAKYRMLPSS